MSMLKKYMPDKSHILSCYEVELQENMSYIKKPLKIIYKKETVLGRKTIPIVKVLWRNHAFEEATCDWKQT